MRPHRISPSSSKSTFPTLFDSDASPIAKLRQTILSEGTCRPWFRVSFQRLTPIGQPSHVDLPCLERTYREHLRLLTMLHSLTSPMIPERMQQSKRIARSPCGNRLPNRALRASSSPRGSSPSPSNPTKPGTSTAPSSNTNCSTPPAPSPPRSTTSAPASASSAPPKTTPILLLVDQNPLHLAHDDRPPGNLRHHRAVRPRLLAHAIEIPTGCHPRTSPAVARQAWQLPRTSFDFCCRKP